MVCLTQIASWVSFGGSYKYSESVMLDFGYSHIFFEDADIHLDNAAQDAPKIKDLDADVENQADILSVGMRMKW